MCITFNPSQTSISWPDLSTDGHDTSAARLSVPTLTFVPEEGDDEDNNLGQCADRHELFGQEVSSILERRKDEDISDSDSDC